MSASRRDRQRPRALCAMVQLHCWLPRTTDPVVMPFLPLASLTSALASSVLNVATHLTDAGSAKRTPHKQPNKAKASSDAASVANAFAVCLAAAAASPPTVPPSATSNGQPKTLKDQLKSVNGVPVVAVPVAPASGVPAVPKIGSPPPAAATTVKTPTPPTPTPRSALAAAAPVAAHPTPAARPAAHASTASTPAAPTPTTAAAPAGKQEGKGEAHLGSHTIVETPVPDTTATAREPTAANPPVSALADPSASGSQRITGAADTPVAATSSVPATQGADNIHHQEGTLRASLEQNRETGTQGDVSSLGNNATRLASLSRNPQTAGGISASNGTQATAASTAAATNHPDSRPHEDANSSTSSTPVLTDNSVVPTPGAVPRPDAAPMPSPVVDQLTQAFLAHADVVQHTGRTDFHLRLDPPQLGSVQIHLTATQHTVSARIVVAQEGTRQLLEGQAHHLRQGLADAGLSLGSFDVTRDGGGSQGGGQQPPPQTPVSPPATASTPRTTPVVSTPVSRHTEGINLLA